MEGEPPTEACTPVGAVFLSYASQDAEAAKRICEALSAAGIEVWFDQSELRGGDAWDQTIRQRIHDCHLFLPVISANTERRDEGYFRSEWRLAVERAGDMGKIENGNGDRVRCGDRIAQIHQWMQPRQAALLAQAAQQSLRRAAVLGWL